MWSSQLEAFYFWEGDGYIWYFTASSSLWVKSIIYWLCDHFSNSLNHLRNLVINYLLAAFESTSAAESLGLLGDNRIIYVPELYIWVRNCFSYVRVLLLSDCIIAPGSLYTLQEILWQAMFLPSFGLLTGFSEANHWSLNYKSQNSFFFFVFLFY